MSNQDIFTVENLLYIIEHLHTAVYIVNEKEQFVYINKAAEKSENLNKADILNKRLVDVYTQTDFRKGLNSPTLDCLRTGRTCEDDNLEWYDSSGASINALITVLPLANGNHKKGVFCLGDDIKEMRQRLNRFANYQRKTIYRLNKKRMKNGTNFIFNDIVGQSEALKSTIITARRFAEKNAPVMIYGETGTGKELFAQSIHNASKFNMGPFVAINCAAIPETLLESMLFGTVKGAFTGAVDSPGLFEKAENGSIFLDEINSMPIVLQAKILRALQEKEVQRIGDTKTHKINCRIISATNKTPHDAIRDKELREDLFFRLSAGIIWLPALRERPGDLKLLVDYFIDKANEELQTNIAGMSDKLYSMLKNYSWPGNIRELSNIIESAVNLTSDGETLLDIQHLPTYLKKHFAEEIIQMPNAAQIFSTSSDSNKILTHNNTIMMNFDTDFSTMVKDYERNIIELALLSTKGNLTKSGEKLGLSRQTLTAKIKKLNINPEKYKQDKRVKRYSEINY